MNQYKLIPARIDESTGKELVAEARTPAKGLTALCAAAGLTLASQDGRYGVTTEGEKVMAATCPWARRRLDPQERTTRSRS